MLVPLRWFQIAIGSAVLFISQFYDNSQQQVTKYCGKSKKLILIIISNLEPHLSYGRGFGVKTSKCPPADVFCWSFQDGFSILILIIETRLFKYIENFTAKDWKSSNKNSDIFHMSAQNIDCGYSLEPPRWGGSNEYQTLRFWAIIRKIMYTPCKRQFYCIKVWFKGVNII